MRSVYNIFNICDKPAMPIRLNILVDGSFVHYLVSMMKNNIVELESVNLEPILMQRGRYEEVIVIPTVLYSRTRDNYKPYIFTNRRSI